MNLKQGDSGGPLFFKTKLNNKTKYILVGLTSYSSINGCNVPNKPKYFVFFTLLFVYIYINHIYYLNN